jgi:hypothetical protein
LAGGTLSGALTLAADPAANLQPVTLQYYNAHLPAVPVASSTVPIMNGTAAVGTGTTWARTDHVHPSDTSRLPLTGGTLTGTLTAPTLTSNGDVNVANGSHLWLVPGVVGMNWSGATITVTHEIYVGNIALGASFGAWGTTPPASKPNVTGAKGSNAALASLLTALAAYGLVTDSTSA